MRICPHCGEWDVKRVTTPCGRSFSVCANCDYGINACTEDECDHKRISSHDIEWATVVLEDMDDPVSFGDWKRRTEELIGRQMEPTEATAIFDLIGGRG